MLAYVCLLVFIGLISCSKIEKVMPSRYEIESSINRTIEEVENMIEENPSLPRLSRNDIVNILYNITSKDMLSIEDEALEAIQRTRADYQRALMVVLPYKLKDFGENLKELYTKPPMVQMVLDETSGFNKDSPIEFAYNPNFYSINSVQPTENLVENKQQLVSAHMRFEDSKKSESPANANFKDIETLTTAKVSSDAKINAEPHRFSFNVDDFDQTAEASSTYVATKRPIYKGTFSRYRTSTQAPKLDIAYSTTPETKITTDAKIDTTTMDNKPTQNVLSSDQWRYNAPPTTTSPKTVQIVDNSPWKPMSPSKGYFLPTVQSSLDDSEEPNFVNLKKEDFQKVMEKSTTSTVRPSPIFVTPSATTNQKKVQSNIKNAPTGFKLKTTTVSPTPMREEVELLLKSIGLQPMKPVKQQNNFKFSQNIVDTQLNAYFDSKTQAPKVETVKTEVPPTAGSNSFAAPQGAIKDAVKNWSPDIQLLFQRFGLQIPGQERVQTTTTTTPKPSTVAATINSYTHFKPLPTSPVKDKDFASFLERFGLGIGRNRNQKSIQPRQNTKRPSLIDAIPQNMRKILENIGLIKKTPKVEIEPEPAPEPVIVQLQESVHVSEPVRVPESVKETKAEPEIQAEASRIVERTTPLNEHIFKPHEIVVDDKNQNEKIKNLLNTVKMVQEGKADVQDVQRVAHDLLQSTKSLANGPDPLKLEEILNNYRDNLKNEVKRQQEETTTTGTTTTTTTSTTVAMPTSEELDETALSSMATTDSSGSFSELSESSDPADSKPSKIDQSSVSSSGAEKPTKSSFFDTFDISDYLKDTNSSTSVSSSTTAAPTESSTKKPGILESLDIDAYLKSAKNEDSSKNSNVSLSDLEDSFGGSTAAPDPVIPTRPKTGLYFLLDWNSFLEVGEDGKEKVNLRFSPKVGDRTRFIPVKIP